MNETLVLPFDQWYATNSFQIPSDIFIINVFIAAVLSAILSYVYVKYGTSLSNRMTLASNFVLIAVTTMFIISVVKSSLALSLGLVQLVT
jgi:hypothetical protein